MSATTATRRKVTKTERVLIQMLTENTGRAMCDSGDYYGRNYERNQSRDFLAEPAASLEVRPYEAGQYGNKTQHAEINATLNVFHWLADRLEYDASMTEKFNRFANRSENEREGWLVLMERFASEVRHGKGIYGEGKPLTVNTYNGEDALSQTLQYTYWTEESGVYVLLQIHGGCDVRGGYTRPRVFTLTGDDTSILDNARMTICEAMPKHLSAQDTLPGLEQFQYDRAYWDTDCAGYHWYFQGACGFNAGKQLEEYEVSTDPADRGNGKIYIDADGVAYGPIYGGKLEVYA